MLAPLTQWLDMYYILDGMADSVNTYSIATKKLEKTGLRIALLSNPSIKVVFLEILKKLMKSTE